MITISQGQLSYMYIFTPPDLKLMSTLSLSFLQMFQISLPRDDKQVFQPSIYMTMHHGKELT